LDCDTLETVLNHNRENNISSLKAFLQFEMLGDLRVGGDKVNLGQAFDGTEKERFIANSTAVVGGPIDFVIGRYTYLQNNELTLRFR